MRPSFVARRVAGLAFVGLLIAAAVYGYEWAMDPEPSTGFTTRTQARTPAPVVIAPTPTALPTATPTPIPTPTPTGPRAEELIAAAREPAATTVQVLESGGSGSQVNAVVEALGALGYNVVAVSQARAQVAATTVWFTEGNEAEAAALRARDPRVAEVQPNNGLNEGVDLHVLVGSDWQ